MDDDTYVNASINSLVRMNEKAREAKGERTMDSCGGRSVAEEVMKKGAKRERGGGGEELASPLSTCILHQQTALPTQKNMFVPEREEKKGGNSYILFGIRGSRNSQTPKKYIYERKKRKRKKRPKKRKKKTKRQDVVGAHARMGYSPIHSVEEKWWRLLFQYVARTYRW